ncbi:MAG TPA: FecR family protein [Blastocatellia bacterium]|nr:FecR family protein [Blastocatellia bacterium]
MFKQSIKRLSSVSPRVALAGALIIVVVVSGVALLLTRRGTEASANPAMQPHAARLERVDGSVGIARAEDEGKQLDWAEATVNTPVTVGDRIYTRDYAHASIALSGQDYVRLSPATSLDVLALEDRRTQFALRSGSALFDVGALSTDELFEVATPCGAVDFKEPGLYQVGMDGGNAIISVLNGLAQVVGQEGSGYISKGQVFTLTGATATEALASTLAHSTAGEIVDDYYRYRYPKVYNGRYRSYDAYLDDPSYYDPYRTSVSYQYLPADIPGLYDLDDYGDWVDVNNYGHCWAPRVSAGWAPFRSGYWDVDDLWGPSWVSSEPWGWAPYHYGRWAFVNQRWFWVPVEVRTRAVYYPAPVAFIPYADQIAWVPLGPGEVYVSRYYDNFQPRYLASAEVVRVVTVQNTFVNFNAPGAVTVVPVRAFTHVIDPRVITPVDAVLVGKSRAVIDPFSVAGVRELAIRHDDGRRRLKFERREQEALNTAVVASSTPEAFRARGDLAKRLSVEAVPEKRREKKLKVNETAQVTSSRRPDGLPQPLAQSQRMSELASRAERGDKSARREMRQLMREERQSAKPSANQPAAQPPAAQQQAEQDKTRQQMKQQRKAEHFQEPAASAQQKAARQAQQQQQTKQQRRAERQQQSAAAAQREQTRGKQQQPRQQEQMRQQRKEQKRKPPEASLQRQQVVVQQRQATQRQAANPPTKHPGYLGPPIRQDAGSQSRKPEKAQRKPPK